MHVHFTPCYCDVASTVSLLACHTHRVHMVTMHEPAAGSMMHTLPPSTQLQVSQRTTE
jgi:hypothetical protein